MHDDPQCGSTFSLVISFPVDASFRTLQEVWTREASPNHVEAAEQTGRNVLIASNRRIEVETISDTLEAVGHNVVRCKPSQATGYVKTQIELGHPVDAVITDTETAKSIRKALCAALSHEVRRSVPSRSLIIVEPSDRDRLSEFREEGFAAYLMRPVRPSSLLSQLVGENALSTVSPSVGEEIVGAAPQNGSKDVDGVRNESGMDTSSEGTGAVNILLAEDNPINALLAKKILRDMGHTVIHVENGEEAAEAIAQTRVPCNPSFDIVFMDLHMPVLDGIAACKKIRQQHEADVLSDSATAPLPPIIALTANAFPEDRQRCLASGMSDFVTKPFEREHLARVIDEWCNGRQPDAGDGSLTELRYA